MARASSLVASLPALLVALSVSAAGDKGDLLIRDYASISRDLHKAQQTQAALLKQKTELDARGADLTKRQDAMNARADAHNAEAANQQRQIAKSKSDCNNSDVQGKNTAQHVNDCDNLAKKLNEKTQEVNAGVLPLETEQTALDVAFAQYTQAGNDWNAQENQNMTALNALYRALNDWADQADGYMGGASFLDTMQATHAEQVCAHRALPDGLLSIDELQRYAVGADRCLRYIQTQRRKLGAGP